MLVSFLSGLLSSPPPDSYLAVNEVTGYPGKKMSTNLTGSSRRNCSWLGSSEWLQKMPEFYRYAKAGFMQIPSSQCVGRDTANCLVYMCSSLPVFNESSGSVQSLVDLDA